MVPCKRALRWSPEALDGGLLSLRSATVPGLCLERRIDVGDPAPVALNTCSPMLRQRWLLSDADAKGGSTLSGPDRGACLDNLQKRTGPFGFYGCHGASTQRWRFDAESKLRSTDVEDTCVGYDPRVSQFICAKGDLDYRWERQGTTLRRISDTNSCLARDGESLVLRDCDPEDRLQQWEFAPAPLQ